MNIKYDKFISLGEACHTTSILIMLSKRDQSYPFDWIKSDTIGLLDAIKNKAMPLDNLSMETRMFHNNYFVSEGGHIHYVHDFDDRRLEGLNDVQDRYDVKFKRLTDILESDQTVLFVRIRTNHSELINNPDDMYELAELLKSDYPDLKFNILFISDDKNIRKHPNIYHFYCPFRKLPLVSLYSAAILMMFQGTKYKQPMNLIKLAIDINLNQTRQDF